jgi:hypothetical protein
LVATIDLCPGPTTLHNTHRELTSALICSAAPHMPGPRTKSMNCPTLHMRAAITAPLHSIVIAVENLNARITRSFPT